MSPVPSSDKAFRTILAGRKCYRMSKDKNEVVWPPHLEAALIEGLEKYTPAESKSPRGLTRFPNRNKFIAEYILKTTGEIRTAKQVGSRIQQLRDTSAGKHIMKEISDRHYEMMHPTRPAQGGMGADGSLAGDGMLTAVHQVVHVYISVPPAASSFPFGPEAYSRQTEVISLSGSAYQWVQPRSLRSIDPTVTFRSVSPLPLYSTFSVFCGNTAMHVENPTVMSVREAKDVTGANAASSYYHSTTLVPGYWDTLCSCTDLSAYTIMQEITKQGEDPGEKPIAMMVIQYHFNTSPAPPLSPFALHDDDLENIDYDEVLPGPPGHAYSTCSDSPYASDRSDSPAYSTAPGFQSVPLSPVEWVAPAQSWASFAAAGGHSPSAHSVHSVHSAHSVHSVHSGSSSSMGSISMGYQQAGSGHFYGLSQQRSWQPSYQ